MTFQLVKASELEQEVLKESITKVDELLRKVDKALRESAKDHSIGSGAFSASVSIQGFNKFVIDKVIEECSKAGWRAKLEYDQQDRCNYLAVDKRITRDNHFVNYQDRKEFGGADRDYGFGAQ